MRTTISKQTLLASLMGLLICGCLNIPVVGQKKTVAKTPNSINCPNTSTSYGSLKGKLPKLIINKKIYKHIANCYQNSPTQEDRNKLIFLAVAQIDLHFYSHERTRRKRNNLFQTVINVLEVGAATAISLTNGERAKSVIADALGFLQGSRDSINKNYGLG